MTGNSLQPDRRQPAVKGMGALVVVLGYLCGVLGMVAGFGISHLQAGRYDAGDLPPDFEVVAARCDGEQCEIEEYQRNPGRDRAG